MRSRLKNFVPSIVLAFGLVLLVLGFQGLPIGQDAAANDAGTSPPTDQQVPANENLPINSAEARGRAKLLHATIHGALQVVHRDFFREGEKQPIPSQSLEVVFKELARTENVQVGWLAINTEAMNVDHKAKSDFEKQAVKVLRSGKTYFESITTDSYQYVGAIRLSAQCVKCHVPSRSSNKDRTAGLKITMPLKQKLP